jgi:hypothetical protein
MFSVSLHVVETFFSKLVPSPRGPLHIGQFSAQAGIEKVRMNVEIKRVRIVFD